MTLLDSGQVEREKLTLAEKVQLEISKLLSTLGLKRLSNALWNDVFVAHLTPSRAVEIACRKFGLRLTTDRKDIDQKPDGLKPFLHRGTASDYGVLGQIFLSKDYDLAKLRRGGEIAAIYDSLLASGCKPLIIDAGANIGASAIWFSHHFPKAHICAFEPQSENYEILTTNAAQAIGDIHSIKAAVGPVDGFADIVDEGQGECGFRTQINDCGETAVVSLRRFVGERISEGYAPFIMKIDIEGGEEQLFSGECGWMDSFPLIIIELHDWLIPRKRTSRPFLKFAANHDRDFVYIGENIFSVSNACAHARPDAPGVFA